MTVFVEDLRLSCRKFATGLCEGPENCIAREKNFCELRLEFASRPFSLKVIKTRESAAADGDYCREWEPHRGSFEGSEYCSARCKGKLGALIPI
jgi:hypothetical protein